MAHQNRDSFQTLPCRQTPMIQATNSTVVPKRGDKQRGRAPGAGRRLGAPRGSRLHLPPAASRKAKLSRARSRTATFPSGSSYIRAEPKLGKRKPYASQGMEGAAGSAALAGGEGQPASKHPAGSGAPRSAGKRREPRAGPPSPPCCPPCRGCRSPAVSQMEMLYGPHCFR